MTRKSTLLDAIVEIENCGRNAQASIPPEAAQLWERLETTYRRRYEIAHGRAEQIRPWLHELPNDSADRDEAGDDVRAQSVPPWRRAMLADLAQIVTGGLTPPRLRR